VFSFSLLCTLFPPSHLPPPQPSKKGRIEWIQHKVANKYRSMCKNELEESISTCRIHRNVFSLVNSLVLSAIQQDTLTKTFPSFFISVFVSSSSSSSSSSLNAYIKLIPSLDCCRHCVSLLCLCCLDVSIHLWANRTSSSDFIQHTTDYC